MLDLDDIQGDVLEGLQKNVENFIFFKIVDPIFLKSMLKQYVVNRITSAQQVNHREMITQRRKKLGQAKSDGFHGINLGFSHNGVRLLISRMRKKSPYRPRYG
jgi:DyP dimeric alpha+beta barrel domain